MRLLRMPGNWSSNTQTPATTSNASVVERLLATSGIHQRWALLCDGCWKEKYAPGKYRIVETVEYEVDWAESPSAAVSAVIDHEDGMKKHFVAVVDRGCERVGDGETPVGESDGIEDASIET